jgi:electron transfer flavoprotein alpha/beta subunit
MYMHHMSGNQRLERVLDTLELELPMVVSHHVGTGNKKSSSLKE